MPHFPAAVKAVEARGAGSKCHGKALIQLASQRRKLTAVGLFGLIDGATLSCPSATVPLPEVILIWNIQMHRKKGPYQAEQYLCPDVNLANRELVRQTAEQHWHSYAFDAPSHMVCLQFDALSCCVCSHMAVMDV